MYVVVTKPVPSQKAKPLLFCILIFLYFELHIFWVKLKELIVEPFNVLLH